MTTEALVSVIMANRNGESFLADAMRSVLCQTHGTLELVLSDDASTDASLSIAHEIAARDPRVKIVNSDRRSGPGAARNRALDAARGDWIAIVDSDDLMHPARLERLIARADTFGADVIADDLLFFGAECGRTLMNRHTASLTRRIDMAEFLSAETAIPPVPVGYLKPVFRRAALDGLRYRADMTVGEDFDLLFRVLLKGATLAVIPEAYYLYRRHATSTSHRLSARDADGMVRAIDAVFGEIPSDLRPLVDRKRRLHVRQSRYATLVSQIKAHRFGSAALMLGLHPDLIPLLAGSARESLARRRAPQVAPPVETRIALAPPEAEAPDGYRPVQVSASTEDCAPCRAAAVVRAAGNGPRRLRAYGRTGLEALGYVPGWKSAELYAPEGGWTDQERRRIAALPWPVTLC